MDGAARMGAMSDSRKSAPPTGERRAMRDRRDNDMAIVGGSDYQEALRYLVDQHGRSVLASPGPDPQNPHDPNAVAIVIEEQKVGYLTADVAKRYGPVLGARSAPMRCPVELHGGEWDVPSVHVLLDFSMVYAASRQT